MRRLAAALALIASASLPLAAPASGQINFNTTLDPASGTTWGATGVGWYISSQTDFWVNTIRTRFGSGGADRDVIVELRTAPGALGGTVLRSSVFNSATARTSLGGGIFDDFLMTGGTAYFVGFRNVGGLGVNFASGTGLSPDEYHYDFSADGSYTSKYDSNGARGGIIQLDHTDATVTPEPMSMALLATGLTGVAGAARRRRKAEQAAV